MAAAPPPPVTSRTATRQPNCFFKDLATSRAITSLGDPAADQLTRLMVCPSGKPSAAVARSIAPKTTLAAITDDRARTENLTPFTATLPCLTAHAIRDALCSCFDFGAYKAHRFRTIGTEAS